ncbi:MAG TPA: glycosyltransferase family 1 protein [Thermoleophilaceae bacterium]|nr:glycosyltransferase family 1 protein [Thermoleophilaceae bacterium]
MSGARSAPIAINARAALRDDVGGVERVTRELVARLPARAPNRYRVVAPPRALAHRAGHAWEQLALPVLARDAELLFSPANAVPIASRRNAVVVHDLAPLVEPDWYGRAYGAWHRALLRATARRAQLAIAPSELVRDQLTELLGMPADRVVAIPWGVDPAFHATPDPAPLRRRLGLDRRPYVLAVGTAIARKNLGLLDAIAPTLAAAAGLDIAIAGGGRAYMRAGGVGPSPAGNSGAAARRLGYVAAADLPALYAGAAAFALPSLYEGFGLPCLEAMAAGTPVVTTTRGALPETCADAALYADPDDPAAFATACVAAATDPATRERLVAAGRERAAAFTWDRTAERVNDALGARLPLP